ncbi:carboxymuconolactone decarboxylase family protein [Paenibacillus mesophilus]|uniref:carboxymuconolactone decarboxylase family protein n=1 Tax=Paenibacillus mesophilus TaxID=2582849 RepID=UPI00110E7BCF|nr:carboxymuconolactone decarboxylase family protein [Paenibacillus mesophilus]TMV50839.1 carboxymuconolactone decarboxylase family protein [Paenibacillus mesophilus]
MKNRFLMNTVNPEGYKAMLGLENYVEGTSIPKPLRELIKIRASQINSCAFCIDMHTKEARALGETEQRIYGLNAWRETPFYTPEERAVLALTEAVTLLADTHVPDDVYEEVRTFYDEKQTAEIIMQIVVINAWNRIGVTTRLMPKQDK